MKVWPDKNRNDSLKKKNSGHIYQTGILLKSTAKLKFV